LDHRINGQVFSMFFSFDGIDGTGKSTQMELFADFLRDAGHDVLTCRDPGGTILGERLREILLHKAEIPLSGRAEMLLYMASRAQLVDQVIRPAFEARRVVVSDRFLLANVVYQGHAGGLDAEDLWRVGAVATGGVQPDLTFVLDMPVDAAVRRMNRQPDRMESRGQEFMERVRQGFLHEAARRPDTVVVDADRDVSTIQAEIREIAKSRWPAATGGANKESQS
jgi:dTMP kinase